MKCLNRIYVILFALLCSCGPTQKFAEKNDLEIDELGSRISFVDLNADKCELYVRTVVKQKSEKIIVKNQKPTNEKRVYYFLTNLDSSMKVDGDSIKIVEQQYLLVYSNETKVLVINNVPNYQENLYNSPVENDGASYGKSTITATDKGSTDNLRNIDIWKFNQFRFGDLLSPHNDSANFLFRDVNDKGKDHVWYVRKDTVNESIYLKRFGERDLFNEHISEVKTTFPFELRFQKVRNFNFVLMDSRTGFNKNAKDSTVYTLKDQQLEIYRYKRKWYLVFRLLDIPKGMKNNIVFSNGRIYATPYFNQ